MGAANPTAFLNSGTFNLEVVQVIPIPAAAVLFSSAIFGLVVVARRHRWWREQCAWWVLVVGVAAKWGH